MADQRFTLEISLAGMERDEVRAVLDTLSLNPPRGRRLIDSLRRQTRARITATNPSPSPLPVAAGVAKTLQRIGQTRPFQVRLNGTSPRAVVASPSNGRYFFTDE